MKQIKEGNCFRFKKAIINCQIKIKKIIINQISVRGNLLSLQAMRKITRKKIRMVLLNNSEKLFCKSMTSSKFWEKVVMAVYQKESAKRLEDLLLSK